jgi:hypothetical protein
MLTYATGVMGSVEAFAEKVPNAFEVNWPARLGPLPRCSQMWPPLSFAERLPRPGVSCTHHSCHHRPNSSLTNSHPPPREGRVGGPPVAVAVVPRGPAVWPGSAGRPHAGRCCACLLTARLEGLA